MTIRRITTAAWRVIRRSLFLLPALAAYVFFRVLPDYPKFTETVFARGIFRVIGVPLGFIASWIPLSMTELLVVLAVPAAILIAVLFVRRVVRAGAGRRTLLLHAARAVAWCAAAGLLAACVFVGIGPGWLLPAAAVAYVLLHGLYFYIRSPAGRGAQAVAWTLSTLFGLYIVMHGLNFYRLPAAELFGLETASKDEQVLQAICIDLAKKASAAREECRVDGDGHMILEKSPDACLREAGKGYAAIDGKYPLLWGAVGRAKPVRLSHWWSYTGITGMYFPFTVEANVNIDQPHSAIPATAAHELAHTRGFAREDECNFYASLACFEHPSADYRYSGYLMAFVYCQNELYGIDKDLWREARGYCSDGVNADLKQRSDYWKRFEGPVEVKATQANNSFIQSHGVPSGVRSYDAVVELLVSWYEKEGLV